jgi:hypothetical protein
MSIKDVLAGTGHDSSRSVQGGFKDVAGATRANSSTSIKDDIKDVLGGTRDNSCMSIKDNIKNAVGAVKDSVSEAGHKSAAEAERQRRDLAGDAMTTGEKIGSVANEAKNNVQAGIDHAKVEARKEI